MKTILLICSLIALRLQLTVTDTDKCSICTDFQSQADCTNTSNGLDCEWKNSACTQAVKPVFLEYCQTITDPATKCAKTFGCAYIDTKCTHFTGCTAYVMTTLTDCQAISNQCITNGKTCDNVQLCKDYTKEMCESNPSPVSPYKCKLENDTCRDMKCAEADNTFTQDSACDTWLDGCVTTGYGCIDVLPNCSQFTGTQDTCNKMIGKDGKCTLDASSTTTPQACKLRVCSEAALTIWDSTSCANYKSGCKTTGFSCVDSLAACSTYTGTATTCLNFIGSDGQCAGDTAATTCRARKCEDKVSGVLTDCTGYLGGCKTNGVTCVTSLGNCSSYKGTTTTCAKIAGADGFCKGTNATDATVSCALRDCAADDIGTETTDTACQLVQKTCKTTGKGCVASLPSCTTYDNDGKCINYIGTEGKCKGVDGAAKCTVRACTDNTTATNNEDCQAYLPGCVTNGAGCVAEAVCTDTVAKLTCQGTTKNFTCGWTESCVPKDCTQLTNQSLCSNTSISDSQPCIWKSSQCVNAVCGDYNETDDTKCNTHMKGCISNGTTCVNPSDCTQFQGTMTTCRGYTKAKCTNTDDTVAITTPCILKTCDDANITATSDSDCDTYLAGCLFNGDTTNKCIQNTKGCPTYSGTSTDTCSKFTGYKSSTEREACWWVSGSNCVTKTCDTATGMTSNADCAGFLSGCIFDGKDGCVNDGSGCVSLKYKTNASECQTQTGLKGAQKCYDGTSNQCKARVCSDAPKTSDYNTNAKCDAFLTGCLSTGSGCIDSNQTCDQYSGSATVCGTFKGNSLPCLRTQVCDAPTQGPLTCSGKTNATSTSDCSTYKNTCVLTFGSGTCQDVKASCTGYTLSATGDKFTYCNQVFKTGGTKCAYDSTVSGTCVERVCHLWTAQAGGTCADYEGTNICTQGLGSQCFKIGACTSYTVPSAATVSQKTTFCNNQWSTTGVKCAYDGTSTTCKSITTCEEVISPKAQDDCYDQSGQSNCVIIDTASVCVTIKASCTSYDISSKTINGKGAFCSFVKQNNAGVINPCIYNSGNSCDTFYCEDVESPTVQSDCDAQLPGCKYYKEKCYTIKTCAQYTLPADANDDPAKLLFCQNMYNLGGTEFCSFTTTQSTCDVPKACPDYNGLTPGGSGNEAFCSSRRDKTTGAVCAYGSNDVACKKASQTDYCTPITGVSNNIECDLHTLPLACKVDSGNCISKQSCTDTTPSSASKITECQALTGPDGYYCSFQDGTDTCIVSKDSCADWTGGNVAECSVYIDKYGNACSWTSGTNCSKLVKTCLDATSPRTQADCDILSTGCIFYNSSCIKNAAACTSYTVSASLNTNTKRFTYCNGRVTTGGAICTFTDGSSNCVEIAACSSYSTVGSTVSDKQTYCQSLLSTDNYKCTYASGTNCMKIADLCTSYTVGASADCTSLKDTFGRTCGGTTTTCSYPACEDITGVSDQAGCDTKAPGCTYSNTKCTTQTVAAVAACSSITAPGSGSIAFCNAQKDGNGNFCNAANDTANACKDRACNDTPTQYFTTHKECQDYSSNCKSDGLGCIDKSVTCANQTGDQTQCAWLLESDGATKCVVPTTLVSNTAACSAKSCELNVTAANQTDCDNYIPSGGCRYKNPGCFSKSVPCSSYRGIQSECFTYIGNSIKCYSDSTTVRGACRNITCADKKTATNDVDCTTFSSNCVYNGVGCIEKTSKCSEYSGTITTCKNYKGDSGATLCWGTSATSGACVDRICTQLAGTSDSVCEAHMPNSQCISDGTTCVRGPLTCDKYKGNDDTCSKFPASNGPCKASSQSATPVACTPRVCYEAPNTYTTDTQCKSYYSTCVTNGRGCQSSVTCGDFSNKTLCSASTACLWTTSCRTTSTTCSSLTSQGQSVCVNNPTKKCAWFLGNGTPANAVCRDYQCSDYDATLTTHDACQKASNNQCTTTGTGCVTFSTCSTYINATICGAATTTEISKKCTWESTKCRQLQCRDLIGATDDECNTKLSGCKTNGSNCIGPIYSCSDFNGSQKYCLIDSAGQPCLYVNGVCYSYDNCTDVSTPSRTTCQAFSSNCVQGTSTCIALNQCSKYTDQVSCYSGISQTTCGWTLDQKCAEFKQCSDAAGTTWADCQAWNSACVSDGTGCVPLGECTSYLKQLSCENNYDTARNACFWTGTACKQKQCSDVTATTDAECVANIVKEGSCTSDGTKCLLRAACTAYASQATCTVGLDAIPCFYGYAVGQTTGNQSCRAKECTDIIGTTNDQCIGQINKKACVSNGKTCVAQGTCASYKNKLSCQAGGLDNSQCIFTAAATTADPNAGTCVAFTSCANANGDKITCLTNKSCKYTDTTNKCETSDCVTFNNGTGKCNPFPSFDGKTFTLCVSSTTGCTPGDPSGIAQVDCWATTRYTYTWNANTNKCTSCKVSSNGNNSTGGNVTNNATTDSGYLLGVTASLALLGLMV